VALFQKVSVTGPLEDEPLLPLLPPLEQAARATPRPSAAIAAARVFFIIAENSSTETFAKSCYGQTEATPHLAPACHRHAPLQSNISYRKLRNTFGPLICRPGYDEWTA
jgi:hypothetical protein